MDNKLSELSKPVGFVSKQAQALLKSGDTASIRPFFDVQGSSPLYSQEYVSALLAELEAKDKRIAELEEEFAFIMGQNDGMEKELRDKDARIEHLEAKLATPVRFKVETDSIDSDVSDRNQPGMVVAVHVDAGDFVKVKGQVYEVKEACFDDHDVTLWFVCGEVLKCAAGCQIEVVSAPEGEA